MNEVYNQLQEKIKLASDIIKQGIKGDDMASLSTELVRLCTENDLFCRDIVTGNVRSSLALNQDNGGIISMNEAKDLFFTYFMDKIKMRQPRSDKDGNVINGYRKLNKFELEVLFSNILTYCTYNSRQEFYDSIPEWDGTPRLETFMIRYFKCIQDPTFFRLMMVGIVGKIKNPKECYVPYWFDFVGEKGIGKTYFFHRLLGKYAVHIHARNRLDDMFVEIYSANAVVAMDDEAVLSGEKQNQLDYGQLKEFTTASEDTFSRKFCQPETHDRAFVFVRTSNESKTVFSATERRQIIFDCKNEPNECYIKDLPQEMFSQLLAEAKHIYETEGMPELSEDNKKALVKQNLDYINEDTIECVAVKQYISMLRDNPTSIYREQLSRSGIYGSWESFCRWAKENGYISCVKNSKLFWKAIILLEMKYFMVEKLKARQRLTTTNTVATVYRVLSASETEKRMSSEYGNTSIIRGDGND